MVIFTIVDAEQNLWNELENLIQLENFKEIHNILNEGNYYLELILTETLYDEYDYDFPNNFTIGYIYRNKLIKSREELYTLYKNKASRTLDINLIKSDIETIYKCFIKMGKLGELDKIFKVLVSKGYDKTKKYESVRKDSFIIYFLTLNMLDVPVFAFDEAVVENFQEASDSNMDYYEDHKPDFRKLKIDKKIEQKSFVDITQQEWFDNLSDKSKNLIEAGTNLLNIYFSYLNNNKISLKIDYSSLLLPFIKAAECEIPILFERYKSKIVPLSKKIYSKLKPILENEQEKINREFIPLFEFTKRINKKDTPNSISFLYHLLSHFELGTKSIIIEDKIGFLPESKRQYLTKEEDFIQDLKKLGLSRNLYIHQKEMLGDITFENYYNTLAQTLKLLSRLMSSENMN